MASFAFNAPTVYQGKPSSMTSSWTFKDGKIV